MSLRTRLLLALAGSGLAILLGGFASREVAIRYATEALIQNSLEARIASMDRETCESRRDLEKREFRPRGEEGFGPPPVFPPGGPPFGAGPGPDGRGGPAANNSIRAREPFPARGSVPGMPSTPRMTRVYFYDAGFKGRFPNSPPFPEAAKRRIESGETFVRDRDEQGFFGAIATSWPRGACAYAVAFMPSPPPFASLSTLITAAFALIVAPTLVLWIALSRPVARIRALASEVRTAAEKRYETSVTITGKDEIAELGLAFNDASAVVRAHVRDVERREKALRDFVAHTTHDVALPLSVLLSHVSRLHDAALPEGSSDAVAAIAQETQYIASLLANLDAVSRLESDPLLHEKNPVDLSAVVERVAVRHRGVAASSGVEFNHSTPAGKVGVVGDVTLIEQAVNNLVQNAIQYNHRGGHVALVLEASGERFLLRVSDDGPGVPDGDVARLGESRFRSAEARSRRPNGMGLGLSIVTDVARRHGFDLKLGNGAEGGFEAILSGRIVDA